MALMIPDDVREFKPEGEGRFYRFLQSVAKPDERFIAWYQPNVQDRYPDFILFSNEVGLVIFEVKDWSIDKILSADPNHFLLTEGHKEAKRKNPLRQAKGYADQLRQKIVKDGRLVSLDPQHRGEPRIPVAHAAVFPNINRYEYLSKRLDKAAGADKILFWDDLHPDSPICNDATGKCFCEALVKMRTINFPFHLAEHEVNQLRDITFPIVRIDLPVREPPPGYVNQVQQIKLLDGHQEAIARQYDGGHRIITGPSGSGKTLILIHKAAFLKQYNPAIKRILFVCFNITLVNYIKRLLSGKKVPLGASGVEVVHFYELCAKILGQPVHYEREDQQYYETVVGLALERFPEYRLMYDAILVDEGQDFSDDMYRVVTGLLNKKTNNLTIALDENQNIYRHRQSWKAVGVQARGTIRKMSAVYRNTSEIAQFAARFVMSAGGLTQEKSGQGELFAASFEQHGPMPEIRHFKTMQDIASYVARKIDELSRKELIPFSEVAVLYSHRSSPKVPGVQIPHVITSALDSRGLMSTWVSEDYRAKQSYDITTDRVTVSTIHSAKGLDYGCVFLVGLDLLEPEEEWSEEQIRGLTYVALTRAKYHLFISYLYETPLITRLLSLV
jgi:superfamily I DNA and RNA helicase